MTARAAVASAVWYWYDVILYAPETVLYSMLAALLYCALCAMSDKQGGG